MGVIEYGGMPSAQRAGAADAQPYASTAQALMYWESLRSLARRYVLDPGTRFDTVHMEPGRYGRLKVVITLEAADGV